MYFCKSDSALACWLCERAERGDEEGEEESGSGSAGRGGECQMGGRTGSFKTNHAVTHREVKLGLQNPQGGFRRVDKEHAVRRLGEKHSIGIEHNDALILLLQK